MSEQIRHNRDYHPRMLKSTGGTSDTSPSFSKPGRGSPGRGNTSGVMNIVTLPSSLSFTGVSVMRADSPTTAQSSSGYSGTMTRNARGAFDSSISIATGGSLKEGSSYYSHRSHHNPNGSHSHHYHHRENFIYGGSLDTSPSSGNMNHHGAHFSHHSSFIHQSMKNVSSHHNSRSYMTRQLQDFMVHQWQQFHERALQIGISDIKIPYYGNTMGKSVHNNNNNNSAEMVNSTYCNSSERLNSNTHSVNSTPPTSPCTIESNLINRKSVDGSHFVESGIVESNSYQTINNSGNYRRKHSAGGFGIGHSGRHTISDSSSTWQRGQAITRKTSSPSAYSTRPVSNYSGNRNVITTVANSSLAVTSVSNPPASTNISITSTTNTMTTAINNVTTSITASVTTVTTTITSASVSLYSTVSSHISFPNTCLTSIEQSVSLTTSKNQLSNQALVAHTVLTASSNTDQPLVDSPQNYTSKIHTDILKSENQTDPLLSEKSSHINMVSNVNVEAQKYAEVISVSSDACMSSVIQSAVNQHPLCSKLTAQINKSETTSQTSTLPSVSGDQPDLSANIGRTDEIDTPINNELYFTPDPPASPTESGHLYSANFAGDHSTCISPNLTLSKSKTSSEDLQASNKSILNSESMKTSNICLPNLNIRSNESNTTQYPRSRLESLNDVD